MEIGLHSGATWLVRYATASSMRSDDVSPRKPGRRICLLKQGTTSQAFIADDCRLPPAASR